VKLSDFRALTFDCYGTLIDWESGIIDATGALVAKAPGKLSRNEVLQAHALHESSQQAQTPTMKYHQILAIVYKRLSEQWGVSVNWEECEAYGQSVKDWPIFYDSVEALIYLKQHFKLVILSNVDNQSFVGSYIRLDTSFDAIYTAEDVGSYKPSDGNFEYMLEKLKSLGIEKNEILHTAESMFHDHAPANRHGLASCWIYRRHKDKGFGATMTPGEMPDYNFRFNSMIEMAEAHKLEMG